MKTKELIPDLKPYVKGAVENDYARTQLTEGAEALAAAYERARRRRVDPVTDRKLHRQVESALDSIVEGTRALATGRDHPKRHLGRRLAILAGIGLAGAGAAIGYRELQSAP